MEENYFGQQKMQNTKNEGKPEKVKVKFRVNGKKADALKEIQFRLQNGQYVAKINDIIDKWRLGWKGEIHLEFSPNGTAIDVFQQNEKMKGEIEEYKQKIALLEQKFEEEESDIAKLEGALEESKIQISELNKRLTPEMQSAEMQKLKDQVTSLQAMNRDYIKSINERGRAIKSKDEELQVYHSKEIDKWSLIKTETKGGEEILTFGTRFKDGSDTSFDINLKVYKELILFFRTGNPNVKRVGVSLLNFSFECSGEKKDVPLAFIKTADKKEDWFAKELNYYKFNVNVPKFKKKIAEEKENDVEEEDAETDEVAEESTPVEESKEENIEQLSDEEKEKRIVELKSQNMSLREIEKKTGVPKSTVSLILKRNQSQQDGG
jgi:hypothetical protein